ncbi:hypothetical protein B2J88_01345 [Rhodococcus sp. SRB_17]|nr:hypothetical protein [Rhodococcus sp. SRB_17]
MDETPWSLLDRLPVKALRRRAHVLKALSGAESLSIDGCALVRGESGGGDNASWLFAADGRILLLVFDHESPLNLYSDYEVAAQVAMYDGIPDELVAYVRGLLDEDPFLMVGNDAEAVPAASGVFWFDGLAWRPADGLETLVAERGLDLVYDSGVAHCTSWYLLDQEFTPESLIADGAEDQFGVNLDQLTAVFAAAAP